MTSPVYGLGGFEISGYYRDQSSTRGEHSKLTGEWIEPTYDWLDSAQLEPLLARHSLWSGRHVKLASAHVYERSGVFARVTDALYYRRFFIPDPGTLGLEADVLDLSKLVSHWQHRVPLLESLLTSDSFNALRTRIDSPKAAIIDEYYCHEVGHVLGWSIHDKYDNGYFRPHQKSAWPLIFVEEFRADMHGLGFAVSSLPHQRAIGVFLYHVAHRLGLLVASRIAGASPGDVPYLLYCLLIDLGWLKVVRKPDGLRLHFATMAPEVLTQTMVQCGRHALVVLTASELQGHGSIDIAIQNARYFLERKLRDNAANTIEQLIESAVARSTTSHSGNPAHAARVRR